MPHLPLFRTMKISVQFASINFQKTSGQELF